jgi:hypothetical protein
MRFVYQFGGREVQNQQTAITIWYGGVVMIYNAVLYLLCIHIMGCYNGKIKSIYSHAYFPTR